MDLERNKVVDLLHDRQAATLANWLREHPGIEIVARDRAGAYADGIRQSAPDAVQVADHWHMLRNLGDAVRAVVGRHHVGVRQVAKEIAGKAAAAAAVIPLPPTDNAKPTAAEQRGQDAYARRYVRYEEAAELRAAGVSIKRIAALIGVERKTIRRWLSDGGAALWRKKPQPGGPAPYQDHLERRWTNGCHNAAQLWRGLVARGFSGRPDTVRQWAGRRRKYEPGAVQAALELPWTTSPAEGQINRLKMLKRTMYDRAGFELPQARVLYAT